MNGLIDRVIAICGERLAIIEDDKVNYLSSQYHKKYNKNRIDIKNKHAWKTQGTGAAFMGAHNPYQGHEPENNIAVINGAAFIEYPNKIAYSITVNEMSGVFIKDSSDDSIEEGHIIHSMDAEFCNIDYDSNKNNILMSVREGLMEKHIALLNINNGHYNTITEGECIDENPVYSMNNPDVIYYDSRGIGMSANRDLLDYNHKMIYKLDLVSGDLCEAVDIERYDCFKPKDDYLGNLYFIKKPHNERTAKKGSFFDAVLIPFRLLKAVFSWMNFFSVRYTGETLTTGGQNPAKSKQKTQEQLFIEGNLKNAEENLKENTASGEKFPGVAPRSWELIKMSESGQMKCVKKGVLDFDIDRDGNLAISNGKYIITIDKDGREEVLCKLDLATKVRI